MTEYYKNISLEKQEDGTYRLSVKVSNEYESVVKLTPDMIEYIISQYRIAK